MKGKLKALVYALLAVATCSASAAALRFDANADGKSDLLWRNSDGRSVIYLMNGVQVPSSAEIRGPSSDWYSINTGDFSGDGKGDILWRDASNGNVEIWLMNGAGPLQTATIYSAGPSWQVTHVADFNGNGKKDLLWRNDDGRVALWLMDGATLTGGGEILAANTGWSAQQTGDFNGDGKSDIVWKHVDGRVAIWLMNAVTILAGSGDILGAGPGLGWSVSHVGDLDGDGKSDLIWAHSDGRAAVWTMNGIVAQSTAQVLNAGSGWSIAHVGDFNGDGKTDLLYAHSDGTVAIALMNGTTATTTSNIWGAIPSWKVTHVLDANGDGKSDLVWTNDDQSVVVYQMNGTALEGSISLLGPGTGWSAIPVPKSGALSFVGINSPNLYGTYNEYAYPPVGQQLQGFIKTDWVAAYDTTPPVWGSESPTWKASHHGTIASGGVSDAITHLDWDGSPEVHSIRTCRNGERWVWFRQYGAPPGVYYPVTYYKVILNGIDITSWLIANCGRDGQPYARYVVSPAPYRLTVWGGVHQPGSPTPEQQYFWDANWSYEPNRANACWIGGGTNSRQALKLSEAWWQTFGGWAFGSSGTVDPVTGIPTGANVVGHRDVWYARDAGPVWFTILWDPNYDEDPEDPDNELGAYWKACLTRREPY